jgi:DNA-damage-inducible protein J
MEVACMDEVNIEKKDALLIAIEEGRTIVKDPNAPRYSSMEGLKAALEV